MQTQAVVMDDTQSSLKHERTKPARPILNCTAFTSSFTARHAFAPASYTTLSIAHLQSTASLLSRWSTRSYATSKSATPSSKTTSRAKPLAYKARAPAPRTAPKSSNTSVNTANISSAASEPRQPLTEPLQPLAEPPQPATEPPQAAPEPRQASTGSISTSNSKTKITPRQLNAFVVNTLSAHREPPGAEASRRVVKEGPASLPAKYRPAARKITLAVVALPIAIVTSWVLYRRLVLGEERKRLVGDLPETGEAPGVVVTKE